VSRFHPGWEGLAHGLITGGAKARGSRTWRPGSGISTVTAWRYVTEKVALLAARAPLPIRDRFRPPGRRV